MTGPYTIKWGIGEISGESREERDIHDAVAVAQANDGIIWNADGFQLSPSDIKALLNPLRALAEEIVGTLFYGLNGEIGMHRQRVGSWTVESAVVAVERCLEGSGL